MKDRVSSLPAGIYFLIGFMGSGKSLLSKGLSQLLNTVHIEMDQEIERKAGKKINAIFKEEGEQGFRIREQQILHDVIEKYKNAGKAVIVSTGGGTPCYFDNMDVMNHSGITIFINPSTQRLAERLEPKKANRPLIKDRTFAEILKYIEQTMEERKPWYNQAMIHVNMIYDDKKKNILFLRDILLADQYTSPGK